MRYLRIFFFATLLASCSCFARAGTATTAMQVQVREAPPASPQQRDYVSVTGNVRSPQRLPWRSGLTLLEAISLAQGITDTPRVIFIYRRGERIEVRGSDLFRKKTANPVLSPGDIIEVP